MNIKKIYIVIYFYIVIYLAFNAKIIFYGSYYHFIALIINSILAENVMKHVHEHM